MVIRFFNISQSKFKVILSWQKKVVANYELNLILREETFYKGKKILSV